MIRFLQVALQVLVLLLAVAVMAACCWVTLRQTPVV
jgi:hypothetical protein